MDADSIHFTLNQSSHLTLASKSSKLRVKWMLSASILPIKVLHLTLVSK